MSGPLYQRTFARSKINPESGFTLIEVVIAVTLMSLVAGFAIGGLRLGARVWEAGQLAAERKSDLEIVHRLMNRFLVQAFPVQFGEEGDIYSFRGSAKQVQFIAFVPPVPDVPGPYVISFDISQTPNGQEIRMTRSVYDPASDGFDDAEKIDEVRLWQAPDGLEFSYFGYGEATRSASWSESWDGTAGMPLLVRLRTMGSGSTQPELPDLLFRVAINMDAKCVREIEGTPCLQLSRFDGK